MIEEIKQFKEVGLSATSYLLSMPILTIDLLKKYKNEKMVQRIIFGGPILGMIAITNKYIKECPEIEDKIMKVFSKYVEEVEKLLREEVDVNEAFKILGINLEGEEDVSDKDIQQN